MSKIEISERDAQYILQTLRHWIATEAERYQELDLEMCSEAEADEFANNQIFLNDFLVIQGELLKKYKAEFSADSNLIPPEELYLTPETVNHLRKFFPLMEKVEE